MSLPEIIFRTVSAALENCGCTMAQIDSVVLSAHDVVDGLSLSSMVTAPAAGAYLRDEIRLAEDGLAAVSLACARIEAQESSLAVVAAWGRASEGDYQHTSRAAFDPFLEQALGMDEFALSSMRLSQWIAVNGLRASERELALEARMGRARRHSRPVPGGARPQVQFPLKPEEAPRLADIAVAAVLGRQERPVRINGIGHSSESANLGDRNLAGMPALRQACARAAAGSGMEVHKLAVIQVAGPTLSDEAIALEAIGLANPGEGFSAYAHLEHINPSGGSESGWCFPTCGLVNLVECYWQLAGQAGGAQLAGRPGSALATGLSPKGGQVAHVVMLASA